MELGVGLLDTAAALRTGGLAEDDDDEEANFGAEDKPIDAKISSSSVGFFFSTFFFGGGALGLERLLI